MKSVLGYIFKSDKTFQTFHLKSRQNIKLWNMSKSYLMALNTDWESILFGL